MAATEQTEAEKALQEQVKSLNAENATLKKEVLALEEGNEP